VLSGINDGNHTNSFKYNAIKYEIGERVKWSLADVAIEKLAAGGKAP